MWNALPLSTRRAPSIYSFKKGVFETKPIAHNLRILLMNSNCFAIFFSRILVMSVQISISTDSRLALK